MNLLLTNDDGWGAPGLQLLEKAAAGFGDVWTVAPATHMSGISHQLTFEQPMTLVERAKQSFSLTGTPADCTRIGLTQLDVDFDVVISGVNNGANLGADVYVSGTVAAAREAWLMGVDGWALSQHRLQMAGPFDWDSGMKPTIQVLQKLFDARAQRNLLATPQSLESGELAELVNVNLPDCSRMTDESKTAVAIEECPLDPNGLPVAFNKDDQGRFVYSAIYNERKRVPGHDIVKCFEGNVAITRMA